MPEFSKVLKPTKGINVLLIGSYDKMFCIKSCEKFANLLLNNAPGKNDFDQISINLQGLSRSFISGTLFTKVAFFIHCENMPI